MVQIEGGGGSDSGLGSVAWPYKESKDWVELTDVPR